eukprot:evm.model.scf_1261.2 EVM.evm.TU.scf_1261.2   scf_1261:21226-27761(-)
MPGAASGPRGEFNAAMRTRDGRPISYGTKWDELSQPSQELLLKLEAEMVKIRGVIVELKNCNRLHDSREVQEEIEKDIGSLRRSLHGSVERVQVDKEVASGVEQKVQQGLRQVQKAAKLLDREKAWEKMKKEFQQNSSGSMYSSELAAPVVLPNEYLAEAVGNFAQKIDMLQAWAMELEKLVVGARPGDGIKDFQESCKNMHDFFVHLGARVEAMATKVGKAKDAYLMTRRQRGDCTNPFEEADNVERLRSERHSLLVRPHSVAGPSGAGGQMAGSQPQASSTSWPAVSSGTSSFSPGFSLSPTPGGLFGSSSSSGGFGVSGATTSAAPFGSSLFGGSSSASAFGASTGFGGGKPFSSQPFGGGGGLFGASSPGFGGAWGTGVGGFGASDPGSARQRTKNTGAGRRR